MIICHCNQLSHTELRDGARRLLGQDPTRLPEPGEVHQALGCQSGCCGCYPVLENIIEMEANALPTKKPAIAC